MEQEALAIHRGEKPAERVWKLEQLPDGTWKRIMADPEDQRQHNPTAFLSKNNVGANPAKIGSNST